MGLLSEDNGREAIARSSSMLCASRLTELPAERKGCEERSPAANPAISVSRQSSESVRESLETVLVVCMPNVIGYSPW